MSNNKFKVVAIVLCFLVALCALLATKVKVYYRAGWEGVYVLKGLPGEWLNLTDDLYPEELSRLLWGHTLPRLKNVKTSKDCKPSDKPCISYEWIEETGRGYIKTLYPDGRKLIIAFGRYISVTGKAAHGLFVGGGVPPGDPDYNAANSNETGMSYYEGGRYFHIWCKVNEGIINASGTNQLPSTWDFVSSKVLESSAKGLTVNSKHRTLVNGVPVTISRTMFYRTGDTYFTYITALKNIGNAPTSFMYVYGDEPWLGNYYNYSKGNVGWTKDGLVMTERLIDTEKNTYIGMFDYGNPLIGESHSFTGKANFLEWDPASRPDVAYFSNQFSVVAPEEQKVPLSSYNNRIISLQWGPRVLSPGETLWFTLKVGMADNDPKTGFPVKPKTN